MKEIKFDVKGLYTHVEEVAYRAGANQREIRYLQSWVRDIAENQELIKK